MKTNLRHQYRLSKNNPFRGEEWVLFANPGNPDDDDKSGPEGEAPASPDDASTPGNPGGSGGPKDPNTGAEGGDQEDQGPQLPRGEKFEGLAYDLSGLVPGSGGSSGGKNTEQEKQRWETQSSWISMLADYNGYQNQINAWLEKIKEIEDPKYVAEDPNFQNKARQQATAMLEDMRKMGIPLSEKTLRQIKKNIKEGDASLREKMVSFYQAGIKRLIEERNIRLEEILKFMIEDMKIRLVELREKWENDPPEGYEGSASAWHGYCTELYDALEARQEMDLKNLMSQEATFPNGGDDAAKAYKEAKDWWYNVCHLEDAYEDFKDQKNKEHSIPKLRDQFQNLENHIKQKLTPEVEKAYEERVDESIKELDEIIGILEKKIPSLKMEEKELRESELFSLKTARKSLEEKKGIKKQLEKALYSDETKFTAEKTIFQKDFPAGFKGQIDFLEEAIVSGKQRPGMEDERRALLRTLSESMAKLERAVDTVEIETDVHLVQTLQNLRNAKITLQNQEGKRKDEIIWVNPFETFGHLWHSIQETVKGNVETEARRGAGYFQKQATQFLESMPNPVGIPGGQVLQSLKELSSNGQQEAEHAEHGRVGDIEKGYKGFNTEHLLHIASETNVRWEFKACLNILAERGRINWYSDWMFKQLNRWQNTVQLPEDPEWHMQHITASEDMMRRAFNYIFRVTDDYKDLRNKNNSAYESKKKEFTSGFAKVAAEPGGLKREADKEFNKFITDHHAGIHFSTADPIKYEAVIQYAIEQGKMGGEDRLHYINKGIAEGFLPFDRGAELVSLCNTYPPVDLYDDATARSGRPTMTDYKEWASYDPVSNIYWMHDHVFYNKKVKERLVKTVLQGASRIDHDDAPMVAGYFDAAGMEKMLKANGSGGYGLPITGLQSFSEGHQFWLDMFAERNDKLPREEASTEITRFASMFIRYEAILKGRMKKGAGSDYYRLDEETGKSKSRTAGAYEDLFGHGAVTMNERIEGVKKYLWHLDYNKEIPFIKRLTSGYYSNVDQMKNDASLLNKNANGAIWGKEEPKTIDEAFEKINDYIRYVTEAHPDNVAHMVAQLKAEHKANEEKIKAKREKAKKDGSTTWQEIKTLSERLAEARHKQEAIRHEAKDLAKGIKPDPNAHGAHGEEHGAHHRAANNNWYYDESRQETRRAA